MSLTLTSRFKVFDANIASEAFGSEIVVVNLMTGVYYSITGSGAQIWMRLLAGYSVQEIIDDMKSQYTSENISANLVNEIQAFIESLISNTLIIEDSEKQQQDTIAETQELNPYSAPVLEIFQDMKEILLLDPVHDVNSQGWPVKPPNTQN